MIITLYGTGAGRPGRGAWWEPGSPFVSELIKQLSTADPSKTFSVERFDWDPIEFGANSESVRRAASVRLLADLRKRDQAGQTYHLVGHSHGGSVIWRALMQTMRFGQQPLKGLASWTTVGTPFLGYGPQLRSIWPIIPIAIAVSWLATFAGFGVFEWFDASLAAWRFNGPSFQFLLFVGAVLGLCGLAVAGTLGTIGYLWTVVTDPAGRRLRSQTFDKYGDIHLCLSHPRDEVLSGFRASLNRPAKIAPRAKLRTGRMVLGEVPFSELWARPLDQLVWQVLGRNIQGDDLPFENLIEVGPSPDPRKPLGWGYSEQEHEAHEASTAGAASHLLHDFRIALAKEGEAPAAEPKRVFGVIDWAGILHTSYFEQPRTSIYIRDRILGKQLPIPVPPLRGSIRKYRPWSLVLFTVLLSTGLSIGLVVAASQASRATISPYLRASLVARFHSAASDPRLSQVGVSDLPGELWWRLNRLGFSDLDIKEAVSALKNADTAQASALAYARYVGAEGSDRLRDEISEIRVGYSGAIRESTNQRDQDAFATIPMAALYAYLQQRPNLPELPASLRDIPEAALHDLGFVSVLMGRRPYQLPMTAERYEIFSILFKLGSLGKLPDDVRALIPDCVLAKPAGISLLRIGAVSQAVDLQRHCTVGTISDAIATLMKQPGNSDVANYLGAFTPDVVGWEGCVDVARCMARRMVDFEPLPAPPASAAELVCSSLICRLLEKLAAAGGPDEQTAAMIEVLRGTEDSCAELEGHKVIWMTLLDGSSGTGRESAVAFANQCTSVFEADVAADTVLRYGTTELAKGLADQIKREYVSGSMVDLGRACPRMPSLFAALDIAPDRALEASFLRSALLYAGATTPTVCLVQLAQRARHLDLRSTADQARNLAYETFVGDQSRAEHWDQIALAATEEVASGDYPGAFRYVAGSDGDPILRLAVLVAIGDALLQMK